MPRGNAAATEPKTEAPKKRARRKRRGGKGSAPAFAAFLLINGGPRKKPKAISTFGAVQGRVTNLVRKGVAPDAIGLYQRRKVKVEQVVKI